MGFGNLMVSPVPVPSGDFVTSARMGVYQDAAELEDLIFPGFTGESRPVLKRERSVTSLLGVCRRAFELSTIVVSSQTIAGQGSTNLALNSEDRTACFPLALADGVLVLGPSV